MMKGYFIITVFLLAMMSTSFVKGSVPKDKGFIPPPFPLDSCDSSNGWLEYERHCYKLISPSGDYGAIEQLCLATGPSPGGVKISSLADVQNQAENDFIAEVVAGGNRAWIAGARYGTDNWIWSLNNRVGVSMGVSYTNWKPNAPDNHLDQEGCIEINRGPAGKWNDLKCTKKRPGVCKYSIDQWKTSIDQLNPGQTKKI